MSILKIKTKLFGLIVINSDTFNPDLASIESQAFKLAEHLFNQWFDYNTQNGAPLAKDIKLCYLGDCDQPAIYSKKNAIRQAIGNLIDYMLENKIFFITSKDLYKADLETAFQI